MAIQLFADAGPLGNNVYLVFDEGSKQALLVDPAMQSEPVWEFLQREELTLEYIVNTHGHTDHIWNNAYFKERAAAAQLLVHRGDEAMLENLVQSSLRWGMKAEPSPPPDAYLEEGATLQVGSIAVQVLYTPGHTPGGCSLYVAVAGQGREEIVITGDTLFQNSIGRCDLPGGSMEQLLDSIRTKLLTLPEQTLVCPGHGPTSDIASEKEHNPFLHPDSLKRMGLL